MSRAVIKARQHEDFDAAYSSVIDNFLSWGARVSIESEYPEASAANVWPGGPRWLLVGR